MNYLIESSFLNSETFGTLLWAEKMLSNFVAASDDKLGLNKCSAAEKKVMRVLSKSFQVEFVETSGKTFLQKTSDSRCPFLTINDYLTPDKIEAHFPSFKTKFQSNISSFPTKYKPYQSIAVQREDLPRVNQKPTNKEVSQHEQSQRSMHSRGSSMSSESNAQISPHLLKKKRAAEAESLEAGRVMQEVQATDDKPVERPGDEVAGTSADKDNHVVQPKIDTDEKNDALEEGRSPDKTQDAQEGETKDEQKEETLVITEKGKEVEAEIPKNQHSIPHRSFEKVTWNRDVKGDTSRLPSMYHILFAILDESDVDFFISNIKKVGQSFKLIKNLGGFAICESEEKAAILFNELNSKLFVYPLKEVPKEIRNDQLRSEICFMEGVRPKKSTNIAERFIYSHLGFK